MLPMFPTCILRNAYFTLEQEKDASKSKAWRSGVLLGLRGGKESDCLENNFSLIQSYPEMQGMIS